MIVLDSSFLLAFHLPDPRSGEVETVLRSTADRFAAPTLLAFEFAHVVSRKMRRSEISAVEGANALRAFTQSPIQYDPQPELDALSRVTELAIKHKLSGYDAVYLELALRLGAELGTLDADLAEAGRRSGLLVHHA